jgi:hypothetical protein
MRLVTASSTKLQSGEVRGILISRKFCCHIRILVFAYRIRRSGCTNSWRQVAQATTFFCTVASNICEGFQYRCFVSPLWREEFWGDSRIFGKFVNPCMQLQFDVLCGFWLCQYPWRRDVDRGCLRTGRWGEYLAVGSNRKTEDGAVRRIFGART